MRIEVLIADMAVATLIQQEGGMHMLSRYEQDTYLEALEQRHSARLILTETVTTKPVKRDMLKYQACKRLLKKAYRSHR